MNKLNKDMYTPVYSLVTKKLTRGGVQNPYK